MYKKLENVEGLNKNSIFVYHSLVLLENKGMKASLAEEELGCSKGYLSRCRSNKKKISLELALKISDILKMSIEDILNFDPLKFQLIELEQEKDRIEGRIMAIKNQLKNTSIIDKDIQYNCHLCANNCTDSTVEPCLSCKASIPNGSNFVPSCSVCKNRYMDRNTGLCLSCDPETKSNWRYDYEL